ncbi:hypothetical protein DPMN_098080 [Dreissena polymorpha]|uniref:Uncharacterized protein n=1 Tax=Dreissena polymorpha TaxID=45954 RepID=A0A9D4R6B4_DREPO|nr:hypothetical protein DPMN_098064 [Dreissena polymorpha]KAH3855512.1 hypothetical protein DPMN_098080 [Dreissena polymorpha]
MTNGRRKKWIEHFQKLLNMSAPASTTVIPPVTSDLAIKCISADALKPDVETSVELLDPLVWKDMQEKGRIKTTNRLERRISH